MRHITQGHADNFLSQTSEAAELSIALRYTIIDDSIEMSVGDGFLAELFDKKKEIGDIGVIDFMIEVIENILQIFDM